MYMHIVFIHVKNFSDYMHSVLPLWVSEGYTANCSARWVEANGQHQNTNPRKTLHAQWSAQTATSSLGSFLVSNFTPPSSLPALFKFLGLAQRISQSLGMNLYHSNSLRKLNPLTKFRVIRNLLIVFF